MSSLSMRPARPAASWPCALVLAFALPAAALAQAVAAPPAPAAAPIEQGEAILRDIQALTAPGMDGRATGTPGNAKARAWIVERLRAIGVVPMVGVTAAGRTTVDDSYEMPFTFTSKSGVSMQGVNLVAACAGRVPELGPIVVSAHYDHLGIRDGQTFHGADDNASGVALLLNVAERCMRTPFERRLVLVFFDAEEQGLQGAKAFVAAPPFPRSRIALNLNFDMVSRSDKKELYVAGPGRWPALLPIVKDPASRASIAVKLGHDTGGGHDDWTQQSDHGPFHSAGIPFIYLGVEDHADYHKPTDTADKISAGFLAGVAAFTADLLDALDRAAAFK